jgi:hypothetical protein
MGRVVRIAGTKNHNEGLARPDERPVIPADEKALMARYAKRKATTDTIGGF